jgi:signal transduction histidine kinase
MRIWLRLTLMMATLTLVPVLLVGFLAVRATTDSATRGPEDAMAREASTLSTFVGMWIDGQSRTLAGWQRVWDLDYTDEDRRVGLLRATYKAIDDVVSVALVDANGDSVVAPQYLRPGEVTGDREAGSDQRVDMLLKNQPRTLDSDGISYGAPYMPPGALNPVVPVSVGQRAGGVRMVAEVSLAPIGRVFAGRSEAAAVLLDGFGKPIVGGDHPFVQGQDLGLILDLGLLNTTFLVGEGDDARQGALYAVPYTDWKVLVFGPPSATQRAARAIRASTFWVLVVVFAVVLLAGLVIERTLTRSVLQLVGHAGRVTEGDYALRNHVDRADEIGDLAQALNYMSQRLETSGAEIAAYQTDLAARVVARTRDLERAQAQLVRGGQIAAVAEMGAGLAHELNNPLAAILGQVQLLRAQGGHDDAALARLEAAADRCREVVDTMMRLASGQVDVGNSPVIDLGPVILEASAAARPGIVTRGVGLDVVRPSGPIGVRIDAAMTRRAVQQLIEALGAGLRDGDNLRVEVEQASDGQMAAVFTPDSPVSAASDDWKAAGMRLWAARGLLEAAGAAVQEPDETSRAWRVVFPGGTWIVR